MGKFKCDSSLCGGAYCCRNMETKPALTIGDYTRLGEHTGKPAEEVWRDYGSIVVEPAPTLGTGHYRLELSLSHDPCPYLNNVDKCSVYETRPLSCGSFPIFQFLLFPEELEEVFRDYKCLQKTDFPGEDQRRLGHKLKKIFKQEVDMDYKNLWRDLNSRKFTYVPTIGSFFVMAERAFRSQESRDPSMATRRSVELLKNIIVLGEYAKNRGFENKPTNMMCCHLLGPLLYPILEDEIAEKIRDADKSDYHRTTKLWKRISLKFD
jgi:Fe-S-cluster containining protein